MADKETKLSKLPLPEVLYGRLVTDSRTLECFETAITWFWDKKEQKFSLNAIRDIEERDVNPEIGLYEDVLMQFIMGASDSDAYIRRLIEVHDITIDIGKPIPLGAIKSNEDLEKAKEDMLMRNIMSMGYSVERAAMTVKFLHEAAHNSCTKRQRKAKKQ